MTQLGELRGSPLAPSTRWRRRRDSSHATSHATLCHHATHLPSLLPPPPPSRSPAMLPSPRAPLTLRSQHSHSCYGFSLRHHANALFRFIILITNKKRTRNSYHQSPLSIPDVSSITHCHCASSVSNQRPKLPFLHHCVQNPLRLHLGSHHHHNDTEITTPASTRAHHTPQHITSGQNRTPHSTQPFFRGKNHCSRVQSRALRGTVLTSRRADS